MAVSADGTVSLHCDAAAQAPILTGLSVPSQLFPGVPYVGHVTLSRNAASDTAITLGGAAASLLGLPATVTVPAGSDTARFDFQPNGAGSGTVTATLGSATLSAPFEVLDEEPSPSQLTITGIDAPASLAVGGDGYVTVRLSGVAPAGGTQVDLSTDGSALIVDNVTIPAGLAAWDAHIRGVSDGIATVTAILGASSATAVISVG